MENFLSLLADTGISLKPDKNSRILPLQTACGNVLLHTAILNGNVRDVSDLLELGISVNVRMEGMSPIHLAVDCGYADIIDLLADGGADIHEKPAPGITLLHLAVSKGHADAVDALLSLGLDVDAKDKEGLTPLYRAAEKDDIDTAEVLLDNGADIFTESGETLLHLAVSRSCVNVIRCLADLGIDVDTVDIDLCTPLCKAADMGNLRMIKELEENGADILTRDSEGNSLLHLAAREGNLLAARTLLDAGIDVNLKGGWWEWTPLHIAADNGNLPVAKLLIEKNANVEAKTSDGKTPLHLAKCNNDSSMCNFLAAKTSR